MTQISYRFALLGKPDTAARTVEASLASEAPTLIDGWNEILDLSTGSVDLTRARDGLPLLFCHKPDQPIGIVENVRLENRKLRGTLRFGTSPKAEEIWADVEAGILRNVSIGYRVLATKPEGKGAVRVTQFELMEASIVSLPADPSVGVGRSFNMTHENSTMTSNTATDPVTTERERCAEITGMCQVHRVPDETRDDMIRNGTPVEEARAITLGIMQRRYTIESAAVHTFTPTSEGIGLSEREARHFSIVRAINAACSGDWRGAVFERECSDLVSKRIGRTSPNGFFVPVEALSVRAPYSTGASATGGALVATELRAEAFVDVLRNRTQVLNMGATLLPGLVGNIDIPRRTAPTPAYWVTGNNDNITEGEGTFDKISLSPKTIGALSQYSRNMLLQSTPAIESLVRNDLAMVLALGVDLAAIAGTGTANQPLGILNTPGIGSVVGGTNGAALTLDHLIALASAVEQANANGPSSGFLLNAASIAALSRLKSTTGQYLWERGTDSPSFGPIAGKPDTAGMLSILGYRAAVTNQLPANLTKGTGTGLSALIFGNWADLIIGEWGVLEIIANPYGSGFASGSVQIRAMQSLDIGVRHAASFAVMSDAITV
ncbi:MAG: phage major capsid protein [Methylococcaceae bacterium]|nr:phage major capsid protein [Methylococcaceae bacterium]